MWICIFADDEGALHTLSVKSISLEAFENGDTTEGIPGDYGIGDDEIYLIQDTGELIFGSAAADFLKAHEADIKVNYSKSSFETGELRPEMYFDCDRTDTETGKTIEYKKETQEINYMISLNQTIPVNTEASNVFNADIGRDTDELLNIVQDTIDAHDKVDKIKSMMEEDQYQDETSQANLTLWLEAAQKEADYFDEQMQNVFERGIANFKEYMNTLNIAITDIGSRASRLALTKTRMTEQKATVEDLKATNEDRELSDIIIDYTAAYTAYQSSLQAAGKLNQSKLLDYI